MLQDWIDEMENTTWIVWSMVGFTLTCSLIQTYVYYRRDQKEGSKWQIEEANMEDSPEQSSLKPLPRPALVVALSVGMILVATAIVVAFAMLLSYSVGRC